MTTVNDDYPRQQAQMSDAELKQLAIQKFEQSKQAQSQQQSTYKFPSEIIDLPSKGLLYDTSNPLSSGKLELKYMTAKEEDILTTQSYIKQGVVLDKLFQSLILGNGAGLPVNYNDLLMGDKNAVMIAARVLGYGKDYEIEITNPSGDKQKEVVDLSQFEHAAIDESLITPGVNRFRFELPATKRVVEFKLLTHKDNMKVEEELVAMKKLTKQGGSEDHNLTTRMIHTLIAVDGNEDRQYIRNFVKNEFLAMDARAFRKYMKSIQPDVDLTMNLTDDTSGEPFTMELPISVDFFWPRA
jgi:hypothetical protein